MSAVSAHNLVQNARQITCIFSKGVAPGIVELLKSRGIVSADITSARGSGKITPLKYRGVGAQTEKEILTVVVDATAADEIFQLIYLEANVDQPHGGLMFQSALGPTTRFVLPDLPEES